MDAHPWKPHTIIYFTASNHNIRVTLKNYIEITSLWRAPQNGFHSVNIIKPAEARNNYASAQILTPEEYQLLEDSQRDKKKYTVQ